MGTQPVTGHKENWEEEYTSFASLQNKKEYNISTSAREFIQMLDEVPREKYKQFIQGVNMKGIITFV